MAESVFGAAKEEGLLARQVIYYREGSNDDQSRQVKEYEVKQIRAALRNVWKQACERGEEPGITCIMASKHHHTRFFQQNSDHNLGAGKTATIRNHRLQGIALCGGIGSQSYFDSV
jgi:hypothetical protein